MEIDLVFNAKGAGMWDEKKPVEKKPDESGGTIQPTRPLGVEILVV